MPEPPPMSDLLALIERTWGFRELRPLQRPAMQAFLEGRDSLTVLPTGGGKSLCFQAPAVLLSQAGFGPTVVVSPLIALMKDQVDSLRELGITASQLDSSLSADDRRMVANDLRTGKLHMLFMSPERLVGNEAVQQMLRECNVRTFAIDEAHCISHWGHDFRPEYRQLARLKEFFPGSTVHAFTATATQQVRRDIAAQLQLRDPELLVGNFDRPNLTYRVLPRRDLYGQIREVLERHRGEAGIIYTMRRKDVDEISKALAEDKSLGRQVGGYHAGMSPDLRRRIQENFLQEKLDVIVATIAFGMGIDRSNIRFIVHAAMPKSVEAYQQETGRAGRDGLEAECVLLYSASDTISWKSLTEKSVTEAGRDGAKLDPKYLPSALKHIDDMDRFVRGATCRHKSLVEYFGQAYEWPAADGGLAEDGGDAAGAAIPALNRGCSACDMCLGDTTPVADSTVIAQKILSCVARTEQRFGAGHIISVLRGEKTQRIRDLRHNELSTYSLLADYAQPELRDFIYQLIGQGVLAQESLVLSDGRAVPILKLNQQSVEVMKGKRQARLIQIVRKSSAEARASRGQIISWEGVDEALFEILRAWRKEIAEERDVPPYVIFSDSTLREIARMRPTTLENLYLVPGIGQAKLKDLGPRVLPLIEGHCQKHQLTMDVMTAPPKAAVPATLRIGSRPNPQKETAFRMFRDGARVAQVAAKTERAASTINEYLAEYIECEKPVAIDAWVAPKVYAHIAAAAMEVPTNSLKPLFVKLGEKIPYDQLRLVVAHLRSKGAL
jgi:ATP-dependent DNA helicase RecQ